MKTHIIIIFLILAFEVSSKAQGFINLDFEEAIVAGYSPGNDIPMSDAFPGWTGYYFQPAYGIEPTMQAAYDALSLGGAVISINDANTGFGFAPLQGSYSAFLFGGVFQQSTTISQAGLVPSTANSIQMQIGNNSGTYNVMGVFSVALDGQAINMTPIATFPTYTLFAGDVSGYANQVVTLSITALAVPSGSPGPNPVLLDNIIFSSSSVPEPSVLILSALGGLFLAWRRWQKSVKHSA